ncbi:unnamed protein product, partial [Sphacelaria rigidula]
MFLGPDGPHEGNSQRAMSQEVRRAQQLSAFARGEPERAQETPLQPHRYDFRRVHVRHDLAERVRERLHQPALIRLDAWTHQESRHPSSETACCNELWTYERCFCSSPVMTSFDAYGKMRNTH